MSRSVTLEQAIAQPGGITKAQSKRQPGETMAEYRPWRDAYAAQLLRPPEPVTIEKTVFEPVEIVREVEVEVVREVFRDTAETLAALEEAKEKLDQVASGNSEYKFRREFLEEERADGEDLAGTDRRLSEEFGTLQVRRPLEGAEEYRRRTLQGMLYEYRG